METVPLNIKEYPAEAFVVGPHNANGEAELVEDIDAVAPPGKL